MSKEFHVRGFIDVRVYIDTYVQSSLSIRGEDSSADDIAHIIKESVSDSIGGKCEIANHVLMIDGLKTKDK